MSLITDPVIVFSSTAPHRTPKGRRSNLVSQQSELPQDAFMDIFCFYSSLQEMCNKGQSPAFLSLIWSLLSDRKISTAFFTTTSDFHRSAKYILNSNFPGAHRTQITRFLSTHSRSAQTITVLSYLVLSQDRAK